MFFQYVAKCQDQLEKQNGLILFSEGKMYMCV